MANKDVRKLGELAFVERELSWLADEAAVRMADPEVAEGTRCIRDDHELAAAELSRKVEQEGGAVREVPERVRQDIRALQREVRHARDQDGLVSGMLEAERAELSQHQEALRADLDEAADRLVRARVAAARSHVTFFESVAPAMAPDIGGSRSIPTEGTPPV